MKTNIFIFIFNLIYFNISLKQTKTRSYIINKEIDIKNHNLIIYTQGLYYYNNTLIRSGGLYNKSTIDKIKYPSLELLSENKLNNKFFGEGIAKCGNYLYQLTYNERVILKYDFNTLKFIKTIPMPNSLHEGWGMCSSKDDDNIMYATDGSNNIYEINCTDTDNLLINESNTIKVFNFENNPIYNLNDIEIVDDYFYANVYMTNKIIKINKKSGKVEKIYNMNDIINIERNAEIKNNIYKCGTNNDIECFGYVLNGIAYNPEKNNFIISGKGFIKIFEVILN